MAFFEVEPTAGVFRMMRFAAGLMATGIIGYLLLALALKILLMTLGVAAAVGVGVFFYRRSRKRAEAGEPA